MSELHTHSSDFVEPYERFHWPSIIGGAFIALALLVIAAAVAAALNFEPTYDDASRSSVGAIIWGILTSVVCFGIAAYIAGHASRFTHRPGMLNGMMVWAVAVPVTVYFIGSSFGPGMTRQATDRASVDSRTSRIDSTSRIDNSTLDTNTMDRGDVVHNRARATAWGTLLSLVAGMISASIAGRMGATISNEDEVRYRSSHHSGGVSHAT